MLSELIVFEVPYSAYQVLFTEAQPVPWSKVLSEMLHKGPFLSKGVHAYGLVRVILAPWGNGMSVYMVVAMAYMLT